MMLHVCKYKNCDKVYDRPWKLKKHYNFHFGIRPYKCKIKGCEKSYSSSSHLHRHTITYHNKTTYSTIYACNFEACDALFQTLWGLKRHQFKHFTNYLCEICNRKCKNKILFTGHISIHEEKSNRMCMHCGKCYIDKNKIDRLNHKKEHEQTYQSCETDFNERFSLKNHQTTHILNFECADCGSVFKNKNNLKFHILTLHSDNVPLYICPESNCSKMFYYKRNCIKHQKSEHVSETYRCSINECSGNFKHIKSLNHHLELHKQCRIKRKEKREKYDISKNLAYSFVLS